MNEKTANILCEVLNNSGLVGKTFYNKREKDQQTISEFVYEIDSADERFWKIYAVLGEQFGESVRCEINHFFNGYDQI